VAERVTIPTFLRVCRSDGTISSMCRRCHATVSIKPDEVELGNPEDSHVCSNLSFGGFFYPDDLKDWED
jgi:hypothetical protein